MRRSYRPLAQERVYRRGEVRSTCSLQGIRHCDFFWFISFSYGFIVVGWQEKSGGGCGWMALAWDGDVPLVTATAAAIILCHAVETSIFFFAPYIPTTYPYHLSFQPGSRLKMERHFPSPSPHFRRNVCI